MLQYMAGYLLMINLITLLLTEWTNAAHGLESGG